MTEQCADARFMIIRSEQQADEQRGLFSDAIWIVFEKFGFLDYQLLTWSEYDAAQIQAPHVVVVTTGAVQSTDAVRLQRFSDSGIPVFLEGPWPKELDDFLGLTIDRKTASQPNAHLIVCSQDLRDRLDEFLGGIKNPSNSGGFVGCDSIHIRDRSRVKREQSEFESTFANVNQRALEPSWGIPKTALNCAEGSEVLLNWKDNQGLRGVLAIRQGCIWASTWEMLSFLAQDYTAAYKHGEYSFSNDRYTVEFIFVSMLIEALKSAYIEEGRQTEAGSLAGLRLSPWPNGKQYALTIRHDVDRVPERKELRTLLAAEKRLGVGVSCYFLKKTAKRELISAFQNNGAEIAYHSAYLEPDLQQEVEPIQAAVSSEVAGFTVHGNPGFYGWRGVANWEVAKKHGFKYCEHLSSSRHFPSRVFKVNDANQIETFPFVCLPHPVSLDQGFKTPYFEELSQSIPVMAKNQMYVTVLNHPDINIGPLIDLISQQRADDYIGMTAAEVAEWWQKTHFRENLSYRILACDHESAELSISTRNAVDGLTIEVPSQSEPIDVCLNGEFLDSSAVVPFEHSTFAKCGWRILVDVPEGENRLSWRWSRLEAAIRSLKEGILDWFTAQNGKPTVTAEKTADFNSTDIESRLMPLIDPVAEILDCKERKSILDVGCGFGGIATYLAARNPRLDVTASDVSSRFYSVAEDSARRQGLSNLSFQTCNILELDYREEFDVVLLSNMLCFLTSHDDLFQACRNAWNATKPGGWVAVFTPHFWSFKEPFTKLPGLQFLPLALRERIAAATGRRSVMKDVRLPSLFELRRIFKRLGARQVIHKKGSDKPWPLCSHLYLWAQK